MVVADGDVDDGASAGVAGRGGRKGRGSMTVGRPSIARASASTARVASTSWAPVAARSRPVRAPLRAALVLRAAALRVAGRSAPEPARLADRPDFAPPGVGAFPGRVALAAGAAVDGLAWFDFRALTGLSVRAAPTGLTLTGLALSTVLAGWIVLAVLDAAVAAPSAGAAATPFGAARLPRDATAAFFALAAVPFEVPEVFSDVAAVFFDVAVVPFGATTGFFDATGPPLDVPRAFPSFLAAVAAVSRVTDRVVPVIPAVAAFVSFVDWRAVDFAAVTADALPACFAVFGALRVAALPLTCEESGTRLEVRRAAGRRAAAMRATAPASRGAAAVSGVAADAVSSRTGWRSTGLLV